MKKEDIYQYLQLGDTEGNNPTYQEEIRWLGSIENGTEYLHGKEEFTSYLRKAQKLNELAGLESRKALELPVASALTMASRAAIRGGMREYDSIALCTAAYAELAACKKEEELLNVLFQYADEFSRNVFEAKKNHQNRWDYVERAKAYIASNRTKKVTVEDVVEEAGVSRSYLAHIFAAQEGVSIHQYITEQKLFAAANIIKYSDASITDIAAYLGFQSPSNMGEIFKKAYGMTPKQYRKNGGKIAFVPGYPISRSGLSYLSSL